MAGNAGFDPTTGVHRGLTAALGALTGLVALIAMIRLVAGAGFSSVFAWIFLLGAMLPWIGYCGWRAWHGRMSLRAAAGVLGLCTVGVVSVWLFTLGPVLALICSLLAFVIIWVHDWPRPRERGETQYVHVDELSFGDQDEVDDPEPVDQPAFAVDRSADQRSEQISERPKHAA